MANRIGNVYLHDQLDDPAEAEVWVCVEAETTGPATEVRGRLMGPRCHYASTVEVAYPLNRFVRPPAGLPGLAARVIIPEASLWDLESPFLYHGPIELWEEGRLCDQIWVSHGLRTLTLGSRGLRLNGRQLTIRGVACDQCAEQEARRLRQRGYNTLLADVTPGTSPLWDAADRLGFLVLGRLDGSAAALEQARLLSQHACCLGWALDVPATELERGIQAIAPAGRQKSQSWVGVVVARAVAPPLPWDVHFILCAEAVLPMLGESDLPKIVLTKRANKPSTEITELLPLPGILGWVEDREQ